MIRLSGAIKSRTDRSGHFRVHVGRASIGAVQTYGQDTRVVIEDTVWGDKTPDEARLIVTALTMLVDEAERRAK